MRKADFMQQAIQRSEPERHWTAASADDFVRRITFDFIAQLEEKMKSDGISQAELAKALGVSEAAVSRVLNDPPNLTLRTVVKYALAVGAKAALVAYDDGDHSNALGPVNSDVFSVCWENSGKPHDMWDISDNYQVINVQVMSVHWIATEQLSLPNYLCQSDQWGNDVSISWYRASVRYAYAEYKVPVSIMIDKMGSNLINA
jgi:transcriptional regulator with XRE-family HTH domain